MISGLVVYDKNGYKHFTRIGICLIDLSGERLQSVYFIQQA